MLPSGRAVASPSVRYLCGVQRLPKSPFRLYFYYLIPIILVALTIYYFNQR